jgi:hypothetical protein
MTNRRSPRRSKPGFTLGRAAFARISAIEGVHLTAEMERDLRDYDERGLSGSERRREILDKYARAR